MVLASVIARPQDGQRGGCFSVGRSGTSLMSRPASQADCIYPARLCAHARTAAKMANGTTMAKSVRAISVGMRASP